MMTATEGGTIASIVRFSRAAPFGETPWPLAMAFSIEALGKPIFFAAVTAVARRGFILGSGPCSGRSETPNSNKRSLKHTLGHERKLCCYGRALLGHRCLCSVIGRHNLPLGIGAYIFFGFVMLDFGPAIVPRRESICNREATTSPKLESPAYSFCVHEHENI